MKTTSPLDFSQSQRPADQASSLPPFSYTLQSHAKEEVEKVFRKCWIGVGRADMIASPGNYITLDVAGQTIILLRDKQNKLRAYANTCRHRGARLLDGQGACKGLRCPFHSWFYGLDGKLVSAPQMEKSQRFDKAEYGLINYKAEERLGFVFVCLDPDAADLDEYLGDFSELHAPWPIEKLVSARRRETTVDCNWKMFLEVFNEYYHLPYVHPNSINNLYNTPDAPEDVAGNFASQFGATQGTAALLEDNQENALPDMPGLTGNAKAGARYTWIFPNMTFAANTDSLWCYEAYPLGADQCKVVQTACFPPETVDMPDFSEKSIAYFNRLDAALDEDIVALENQQRGMTCPDARSGRFQPDLEPNVAAFAKWYAGCWAS